MDALLGLDMEGAGTPENGDAVAGKVGGTDFKRTTLDEIGR